MTKEFSFKKGWGQVRRKDTKTVKIRIMKVLHITTKASWGRYLNGITEPKAGEYIKINSIFSEYGITDVWGE
jgi:hypothetical protein